MKKFNPEILTGRMHQIINIANALACGQKSGASSGERIAAAFVLNRMDLLPASRRDVLEAWMSLEVSWQRSVWAIKQHHMHLVVPW